MKSLRFRRGRDLPGAMRSKGQRELRRAWSLQDLREQFARIDKACEQEEARLRERAETSRLFGQPKGRAPS
jgi:hypothetical protein